MLDLVIVAAFVVYAVSAGFRARRQASKSLGEYFLAGRTLSGWRAGVSMAATQFAADTPLLVSGLVATAGVFMLWRLWIYGLAFLLMAFVFARCWRRAQVLTDAELAELRYGGRGVLTLRVLKAIYYGTVINCVVLAMVMVAAVRIAEVFLPWSQWLPAAVFEPFVSVVAVFGLELGSGASGLAPDVASAESLISILLILGFTALYSTTGGLRSVVSTDVMQFALAMGGSLLYAWYVLDAAGGLSGLVESVTALYPAQADQMLSFAPPMSAGELLLPFLVLISLQWFFQMYSDGTGYLAQRSMACATDRDARLAGIIFAWLQILLRSLIWLIIAVSLLVVYPFDPADTAGLAARRELTFVQGVDDLLPAGARGLMLAGLLGALASTVDTHLNWGASYWSNDVYGRLICGAWLRRDPSRREMVTVARLSNVLILALTLLVMANLGSIQTAWFISLLFGAGMGGVLVLRWLWERITLYSELAAIVTSLVTAPLLLLAFGSDPESEWQRLGIMSLVTTGAAIAITWVTPATPAAILARFYRRVRPVGAWATTAAAVGDVPTIPRRRLLAQARDLAICSASLFLLLVGCGRALIGLPDTSTLVTWLLVLAGLGLVPFWWRSASKPDDPLEEASYENVAGEQIEPVIR